MGEGRNFTVATSTQLLGTRRSWNSREMEEEYLESMKNADQDVQISGALPATNDDTETEITMTGKIDGSQETLPATVYRPLTKAREKASQLGPLQILPATIYQPRAVQHASLSKTVTRSTEEGRNRSSKSPETKSSRQSEIYFSPIDVNKSQIELSSPTTSPPITPTPESYNAKQSAQKLEPTVAEIWKAKQNDSEPDVPMPAPLGWKGKQEASEPNKLKLTPEQLDQLVEALVKAPMMQKRVRKQWWNENVSYLSDGESALSLSPAPTEDDMITGSSSPQPSELPPSSIFSLPNDPLVTEQRSSPAMTEIPELESVLEFPQHHASEKPLVVSEQGGLRIPEDVLQQQFEQNFARHASVTKVPETKVDGFAIVNPAVENAPICFVSRADADECQVGECSHIELPFGTAVDCHLQVEPAEETPDGTRSRVILQILNQVLWRSSGKRAYVAAAEIDVTEAFTKAALMELLAFSNRAHAVSDKFDTISLVSKASCASNEEVDWFEIANSLQLSDRTDETLQKASGAFASLTGESCTMQTLSLTSHLARLKSQHEDFLILRGREFYDNGIPSRLGVPWISQHLDQRSWGENGEEDMMSKGSAEQFQEKLIGAVGPFFADDEPLTVKMKLQGVEKRVYCVPLADGIEEKTVSWVCFVRDEFDV